MKLRPYQDDLIVRAREAMNRGVKSLVIVSPTGSGKTALTSMMLRTAASRGFASFFINHRVELIRQSIKAFDKIGLRHGVISAGYMEEPLPHTQICSISSLVRRYKYVKRPKLIVWDECHHINAKSWSRIREHFSDAFHIGLTATPWRLDGKGLGDHFDEMVIGPSTKWLIENGYLSKYKMFAPSKPDLTGVHKRMGDFVKTELSAAMDRPTITGNAVEEYRKRALGKRCIAFAVSIEHSLNIVNQFRMKGVNAVHLDGDSDKDYRADMMKKFQRGEIHVISNCDLFGEGLDVPGLECVSLLRPTTSLSLYLQQVGRSLRVADGKDHAIILDHANLAAMHGLPDEERSWSLEGRAPLKRGSTPTKPIKICSHCFGAQPPGRSVCIYCKEPFEIQSREVDEVEGTLSELTAEEVQRRKDLQKKRNAYEKYSAKTKEDLVKLALSRGYKKPHAWAHHVCQARQRKKNSGRL